ncbi:hypothetical protein RUM44_000540 [Polyplax serrata]|uniref:Uncharacterized protein n=1 Tax=Polyplax serrata TaxID=468196 RepID=A0ABR1B5S7_POLSC
MTFLSEHGPLEPQKEKAGLTTLRETVKRRQITIACLFDTSATSAISALLGEEKPEREEKNSKDEESSRLGRQCQKKTAEAKGKSPEVHQDANVNE